MREQYHELLTQKYPNEAAVLAELARLKAILHLPKGTEYFFSDLHGEHGAFLHMLRSASGSIRGKIDDLFGDAMDEGQREDLAALIYWPQARLEEMEQAGDLTDDWCQTALLHLTEVCRMVSSKYTRSRVRKKLPAEFSSLIEELLYEDGSENQVQRQNAFIGAIIEAGGAKPLIIAICDAIGRIAVDTLHIIGDIYDRGPRPDAIMQELMKQPYIDIQWGNHDITWMGAAAGSLALIATVLRIGISYNNFDLLETAYGISLRPLSDFAATVYKDDPCEFFALHVLDENQYDAVDLSLGAKMHKAIAVIQFKLEGQIIARRPEFQMEHRDLLSRINYETGELTLSGVTFPLRDSLFPTIDPHHPNELTEQEAGLMEALLASFRHSEPLQRHVRFLYSHGSMYKRCNGNLLYHGCIPMTQEGALKSVFMGDQAFQGRAWLDHIDHQTRVAYFAPPGSGDRAFAQDFVWYLWCGSDSPLFGKDQMTTFERYFIEDKRTHKENTNPYFHLVNDKSTCELILRSFDLDPAHCHIINGHVPVKVKDGEHPCKGGGLYYVIDGGMSKAYQKRTGIGGYTLIFNSRHLALATHQPYVAGARHPSPSLEIMEKMEPRLTVADTDAQGEIAERIEDLQQLLATYHWGEETGQRA